MRRVLHPADIWRVNCLCGRANIWSLKCGTEITYWSLQWGQQQGKGPHTAISSSTELLSCLYFLWPEAKKAENSPVCGETKVRWRKLWFLPLTGEDKKDKNWLEIIFNVVNWNLGKSLLQISKPLLTTLCQALHKITSSQKSLATSSPVTSPEGTACFLPRKRCFCEHFLRCWCFVIPKAEPVSPAEAMAQYAYLGA